MKHAFLLAALSSSFLSGHAASQEWSRFRGPAGQGILPAADLPRTFTESNVLWRVPTGGTGQSSTVLWGDRLFFVRRPAGRDRQELVCLDTADGRQLWTHAVGFETYHIREFNSYAASTPVVDGDAVYFCWQSEGDLFAMALDHGGEPVWQKDLGPFVGQHGSCLSPMLIGDLVVFSNEGERGAGSVMAVDRRTGQERWKIPRQNGDNMACYVTPFPYRSPSGEEVLLLTSTSAGITAVDPVTGSFRWEVNAGLKSRTVGTPALLGDLLLYTGGAATAGKDGAVLRLPSGDAGEGGVVYRLRRHIPYVPSTLALDGRFWLFNDSGVVVCLEGASGEELWRERLPGSFFSSPVSNGEVIYIADREGVLYSLSAGDRFEVLGRIGLGSEIVATPAIADNSLFLRSDEHVFRLGKPD